MSREPTLTEVRRQPEAASLSLTWTDGFQAELGYRMLRGYCPCAGCQGHWAQEVSFHDPQQDVEAQTITPVGNYAISIQWSDGHATGIYRFDFLRQLATRTTDELEEAKR